MEVTQVTFRVRHRCGDQIGSDQILSTPQLWDTDYRELENTFYLDDDLLLEIETTLNSPIIPEDFEVRWVQLIDDEGSPVRSSAENRPPFEIENYSSATSPLQFTYDSGTYTLIQTIDGADVPANALATLTMETFIRTGSPDQPTQMVDGPTICVHRRVHLIAATAVIAEISFAEDDTLTLTFDQPTNKYTIDNSNIDQVLLLPNGITWGTINNTCTSWLTDRQLKITFGSGDHTVAVGDQISIAEDTIKDPSGNEAVGMPTAISLRPHLVSAVARIGGYPGGLSGRRQCDANVRCRHQPMRDSQLAHRPSAAPFRRAPMGQCVLE